MYQYTYKLQCLYGECRLTLRHPHLITKRKYLCSHPFIHPIPLNPRPPLPSYVAHIPPTIQGREQPHLFSFAPKNDLLHKYEHIWDITVIIYRQNVLYGVHRVYTHPPPFPLPPLSDIPRPCIYTLWIIYIYYIMNPSATFNYHFCIFGSVIFINRTRCFRITTPFKRKKAIL